jgi:hypothetical protein
MKTMGLTEQQVNLLIQLAVSTTPDEMDCDGCFVKMAEFAEAKLSNQSISASMQLVEDHLNNCPCCKDEFEALRAALGNLSDDPAG